ncbi:similar to Saccharomyces cerevisiae YCL009C ILV6 Regulatory subunit of acetolactate synthase, which catalyzes the first step of branched-chain amino acid biosynthesis [Maudiozyma barnettii]|uniref:Similar to Saccharomyces cerevisiae YCL009C ILV6 Regulatory subunit of acetolactate synthase, which catalyzes the first step of branched-chain amino acid biosynthesis n=1 Tax=Maudiozyma barnettii TaxID=61262 RepID=A0A8H2VJL5_9SACH|nr:acetolactate synthase regulatory subunit [Kazachstania barnettii]CAB4256555.1 similar to Saccharomyces cerevisiae YCL009C ILV6 Regulatory subunit of acetolactate synthase, which catalyzes the first step of branched-chain amino acid biosynthesis [Kazachstania barnettii]CAD1785158.1 similar to Saccharomyces cerevisiae YCL009C ILV6 Regulatory subunit of acetolactate synthase, which catalyzes the first step of branched-chain amino acid biosynthesis [Kazachstania barnettii]
MLRSVLRTTVANSPACGSIRYSSSSTSAMAYKQLHRHAKRPPLPTVETPAWDANTAVSSILYDTPTPSKQPKHQHVLNCLVQNEPGVLSRISGTLAARGFNIDSLVVCNTEVKDLSRMTIVLQGQDSIIEQARRQIEDLVPVYAVLNYTNSQMVKRELVLARISLLGSEYFQDLLLNHHHDETNAGLISKIRKEKYHPSNLLPSEVHRLKHQHLNDITNLAKNFGGKIVDISETNCIVELAAKPTRVSAFIKLLEPFGVLECTRSGMMALPRTPLKTSHEEAEEDSDSLISEIVDISQLPPG